VKKPTPTTVLTAAAAVAAAGTVGIVAAPTSSAEDATTTTIGSQAKLVDGNVVQGWTVTDLRPSSDVIPYAVAGTLWEATASDEAIQGAATPIVSNLNARARSGQNYRVLFGVATPQGVNPATLGQGEKTTGKVYFDVTGDAPDAVVYSTGGNDVLAWVQAAPAPRQTGTGTQWSPPARSQTSPAPAATPATPAPAAAAAPGTTPVPAASGTTPTPAATPAPAALGAPLPASAEAVPGAPLPAGSQGTPLPAGSQGAPAAAAPEGTPIPASTATTPQPAGSQGTPATPVAPATPVTTVPPLPAG
jgi:Domain of unknown function (DUF1942)